jgi:hypothetical protein
MTYAVAFCTQSYKTLSKWLLLPKVSMILGLLLTETVDVPCTSTGKASTGTRTGITLSIGCHSKVVKGTNGKDAQGNPQGHRDAEAFAMYAMGMSSPRFRVSSIRRLSCFYFRYRGAANSLPLPHQPRL